MPVNNVGDVLATAVMRERAGEPETKAAQDAIADILAHGVTREERTEVAQMLHNLEGTPHAGLARRIFDGVAHGADAGPFEELKDKLTGPEPEGGTPSVTWREEVPTAPQQKAWNAVITQTQLELSGINKTVGRGFHQKQIFGGAARMKVNPSLPKEAQIPPFWDANAGKPVDLAGVVRMSNGQGCPFKDAGPDVRGLAVKLVDPNGKGWDILSTNRQTFAEDVPQFIGFTKASKEANLRGNSVVGELKQAVVLTEEIGPVQATRISTQLAKDTVLKHVNGLATESFDGGTFKTPDGHLAKVLFTPVPGAVDCMTRHDVERDENGLTTELYRHFESGPVKFRVQLKIFCGKGDELKANDRWEPSRIIDVGELSIPPPDKAVDQKVQTLVNGMRFNPGTGFQPAGQMTHARGAQPGKNGDYLVDGIYKKSADNRLALDDTPAVLSVARGLGNGDVDAAVFGGLVAEVEKRNAQMAEEVEDGTVAKRLAS